MKKRFFPVYFLIVIFLLTGALIFAGADDQPAEPGKATAAKAESKAVPVPSPVPAPVVTEHTLQVNGKTLKYKATTGYMEMKDENDKQLACIFYIAYTLSGTDIKNRPVTFTFNGGPGSSSIWLHMGALGPKRVKMSDDGLTLAPPYRYFDNPFTWLEFTDLVFIDPVSTGYSRPAPGVNKSKFHGVEEDVTSVGDFIRLYVTKNERWLSPIFICGESYGTTRAAGLSGYLQERHSMYIKGIVLVSAVLHFQDSRFGPGSDVAYALFLPTYTASAWYHGKLAPQYQQNLPATLKEVEEWALNEYWLALAKGDDLVGEERARIRAKLSAYTGLSEEYLENTDLRVFIRFFMTELLRDKKQVVGRLDSRFKTDVNRAVQMMAEFDPSMVAIQGPFAAVFNHYARTDLNYKNDLPYEVFGDVDPWNWGTGRRGGGHVNVAEILRSAMEQNPNLKVMVACGYYDLATPYFAIRYTVNHMGLPETLRDHIRFTYYEAGHMMYIHQPSLKKLLDDVRSFYGDAVK